MLPTAIFAAAVTTASASGPRGAEPSLADAGRPRDAVAAEQPHLLSARVQLGVGGEFAGHASVGGEGWLGKWVGLGAHVAAFGAGELLGESRSATGGGPSVALRSSATDSYGLLTFAAGVARLKTSHGGLCWDGCGPPEKSWHLLVANGAGWMYHLGGFEIGPILRLDAAGGFAVLTLNLAMGFATAL